jgi:PAS domain S-box-containing protein
MENLQEVVFTTDLQGHFTYINPIIEQFTGYKIDQVLGGTFKRFIHPDDFPGLKSSFKRAQGGLSGSCEFRILHKDGKILHVHTSSRLIKEDGRGVGLTGVMVEITDLKNNEQVLLEAEAKYHTLIDQIPAAVYTVAIDEPGSTLYISPQIEKLSGYTPEEWIADPALWDKIILPEDHKKVRAERRKTNRTGKRFLSEYRLIARDGYVVWVRDEATLLKDTKGEPLCWQGVMLDISEKKQAEMALRQRVEELAALQATVLDLAVQQDLFSLLRTIVERSITLLKVHSGFIYLYDESTNDLVLTVEKGFGVAPGVRLKMGEGMAGRVAQTRQTLIIDDYSTWEGRSPIYSDIPYHAIIEVPMVFGGQLIGVLGVNDSNEMKCKFTEADGHLLLLFAGQAASVVHDSRLLQGLQLELTERKRVDDSLREAEARYRAVVEQIPAIIYTDSAEQKGHTLYVSPQIKTIMGYDPDEWTINNDLWTKVIFPEDRDRVLAEYNRTYETGEPFNIEYRMTSSSGKIVWVRDEAVLIRDQSDRPLFWQGIILDITERKQAEVALGESEERYRRLFDLSPDAIAVHDGGKILLVNKNAMELMGVKNLDEIIGKPLLDFVHPDYRKLVIERTQQQMAQGRVVPAREEKFVRLDGTYVDVEVTAAPIHFQDTLASLVIFRDITERKRAQALQEAVYRIAIATETTKSLNDLFPQIHGIISSVMPAENFYITLYDAEHNKLRFQYFKDALDEPYLGEIQPGQGLTAYVLRTGKSLLCTQAVHDELERQGAVKLLGVPSAIWLGVPLIIEGKTIGAMVVQHYSDPVAYGEREQHMLEFVSTQVAIAISRKQAEDDLRIRTQEAETLREATAVVASTLDSEDAVRLILEQLALVVPYDSASVQMLNENYLEIVGGQGWPEPQAVMGMRFPIPGDNPNTMVIESLKPFILNNADIEYENFRSGVHGRIRSWLGVPLIVREQVIGILAVDSYQTNYFSEEKVRLVSAFANQAAAAIANTRLYKDALQAAEHRAILHSVSQDMVTAIQEPEQTYQSIHQATRKLMPCDSFVIALHNEVSDENMVVYALEGNNRLPLQHIPSGRGLTGKVLSSGEPVIIDDLLEDKTDVIRFGEPQPIRSLVAVPLRLGQKTTGMISAQSYKIHAFGQEEQTLLEMLASYAAVAIENARLYQEAVRATERRSILYRASQEIAQASQDPERVYAAVHRAAEQLMPAEAFAITLLDEQSQETIGVYLVDKSGRAPIDRVPGSVGLSGLVISTGKPVITTDLTVDPIPGSIHFGGEDEVRSILAVPLRLGEKVIGMLSVQSYLPHAYTDDDQALLEMLAAHSAVAIDNARLYNETLQRLKELEAVNHISTTLRTALTVDDMLPSLLDETLQVLGSDSGVIWLYDPIGGVLIEKIARGWFTALQEKPLKPGDGIAGTVFKTGQVCVSKEFATDPLTLDSMRNQLPVGWGGACVPIRTGRETIGVLFVSVKLPRQLQADAVHLLVTLSEMAGNAVRRATLHEQTERQLQRLASLRAVDMAINTILDLRVMLGILIDHIVSQLKVDAVNILLINPNAPTLYQAASSGFRSEVFKNTRLYISDSLAGQAIRTRTTIHIPNLNEIKLLQRGELLAEEGFVTYFAVPLIAKGQIKGVLETFHRSLIEPDLEWRNFLETLAGQAAIAIDNSVLFEELQQTNMNLSLAYDATIEGWSKALDLRDKGTEGHTLRVAEMTVQLADILGVSMNDQVHIRRGALLHDIGEMGVPDNILDKTGPLTEEEWAIMHRHPEFAFEMLSPIAYLRKALDIPYGHHERWDGSGYPRHLPGEQIPLAARIFAVVDVWDAMISDRSYRKPSTKEAATEFVRKNSGILFDPRVVEAFLRMIANEQAGPMPRSRTGTASASLETGLPR